MYIWIVTATAKRNNARHTVPSITTAFETIITRAIAAEVDVLLIAGDLFDHNRVPDETIAFTQEQLRRLQRPVVILPGNHDCLYTNAIYDRHNFHAACNNVQVITELNGQVIEFPDLDLVVWGRAMEEHTPGFHPLAHIPTRHDQRWHIAMAHGFFYETRHSQIVPRPSSRTKFVIPAGIMSLWGTSTCLRT